MSAPCSEPGLLFSTARLGVRGYDHGDRADHQRLRDDPAVRRFMHWPDDEDYDSVLADGAGRTPPDTQGWINLAIVGRPTGRLIGDHGLIVQGDTPCIGLALLPEHRGRGLGRELVVGSMRWLAAHGYRRVRAEIDYGNAVSFALFASLGFTIVNDRQDAFGPYTVVECPLSAAS